MSNILKKSLTDLIDETLQELDELRKSRFSASEIKIEGPGAGIAGKPVNGDIHAEKAEDEEKDEKEEKDEDVEKGCNDEAEKSDDEKDEDKEEKDEEKEEGKEKKIAKELLNMHKSVEESNTLMKSYVEERVRPLEDKLSTILDLVNKIADQPIAPKGLSARAPVTALMKSEGGNVVESLSKSQVASKLFDLKKSGTKVDSVDITKAEMGQDLQQLIKKYEIS